MTTAKALAIVLVTASVVLARAATAAETGEPPAPGSSLAGVPRTLAASAAPAADGDFAPAQDQAPQIIPSVPRWNLEVFGGSSLNGNQTSGSGSLPTSGAIIGGRISGASFYFGSGTQLFNQANAATGAQAGQTIRALDPVLLSAAIARHQSGRSLGGRLGRSISDRFGFEITAEYAPNDLTFTSGALAAIEATRASYIPALARALSSVPASVTSTATFTSQSAQQLFVLGALEINLKTGGKAIPYVTGGAGAVFNLGDLPSATLVGRFQIGDPVQIAETDSVTLRYSLKNRSFVGMGGGGLKYSLSSRWGLRFDGRVHLYQNTLVDLVDTAPAIALTSTGSSFPLINSGALQFSSTSPMNGPSLLSASSFTGSGLQLHVSITAGLFLKF